MSETTTCALPTLTAPLGWRPPRFAWASLFGGVLLSLLEPASVGHLPVAGGVAIVLGLAMAVGEKRRFKRVENPVCPSERPTVLLTDGWYRWTRNPMYVGLALVLLGVGLVLGTWPSLLAPPVFLAIVRRFFVPHEEGVLAETFGEDWRAYAARVPRWI